MAEPKATTEVEDNWENEDKLDRKKSADFLTNYLTKRYKLLSKHDKPDTFVMNIRADWGFGKTFFLQKWAKDLEHSNYPVVFYDAWANDFCDDPLIGFIAEINESLAKLVKDKNIPHTKKHLDDAMRVGRKLIKPMAIGVASILAKKLSGYTLEQLKEVCLPNTDDENNDKNDQDDKNEITSLISKCADLALKEHIGRKETIATFKRRLETLIESLQKNAGTELPLFIFIDELDRCRPTYAIELLEAVKHLFGVKGIYFVVATNLEQLGHSIRAVYGEQFDSERYLKRFFDQEYLLPTPDGTRFTAFLFERYLLNDSGCQFYTVIEDGIYDVPSDQALFTILADTFNLSLRDQEQVAGLLQAILLSWPEKERVHLAYLLFLIIVKQVSTTLFQQLAENRYNSKPEFLTAIQKKLRENSSFKTKDRCNSDYHAYTIQDKPVAEMLWHYQHLLRLASGDLSQVNPDNIKFPEKISFAVISDLSRTFTRTDPLKPISDYARRVSQAGQLAVPIITPIK